MKAIRTNIPFSLFFVVISSFRYQRYVNCFFVKRDRRSKMHFTGMEMKPPTQLKTITKKLGISITVRQDEQK